MLLASTQIFDIGGALGRPIPFEVDLSPSGYSRGQLEAADELLETGVWAKRIEDRVETQ